MNITRISKKTFKYNNSNWNSYISQHTDLLEADGIHPMEPGADAYAHLIQEKINEVMQKQKRDRRKKQKNRKRLQKKLIFCSFFIFF